MKKVVVVGGGAGARKSWLRGVGYVVCGATRLLLDVLRAVPDFA